MSTLRIVVMMVVVALFPLAARAGLAPTKGSQIVSAYTFGACPIPGHTGSNSSMLSQMVNGDGSVSALVIPPKHILVLSDVAATTGAEPPGDLMAVSILVGSAATGIPVAARFDTVASSGAVNASFEFPTGIKIQSGAVVCVEVLNLTHGGFTGFTAFAHGYLAPDK